jgi:hypothetical protein
MWKTCIFRVRGDENRCEKNGISQSRMNHLAVNPPFGPGRLSLRCEQVNQPRWLVKLIAAVRFPSGNLPFSPHRMPVKLHTQLSGCVFFDSLLICNSEVAIEFRSH